MSKGERERRRERKAGEGLGAVAPVRRVLVSSAFVRVEFGMSGRASDRKKTFKKGIDSDDSRRKREETRIVVRKEKRDEALRAKRQGLGVASSKPGQRIMGRGGYLRKRASVFARSHK